jgi:hypothetical protein
MPHPLLMHSVITQFHRSCKYLIVPCWLVNCAIQIVTCLSGRVMGCHSYDSVPTRGHEDDPDFLYLLLNSMTCHLLCIFDTLFNVYDPPIKTDLWMILVSSLLLNITSCHLFSYVTLYLMFMTLPLRLS